MCNDFKNATLLWSFCIIYIYLIHKHMSPVVSLFMYRTLVLEKVIHQQTQFSHEKKRDQNKHTCTMFVLHIDIVDSQAVIFYKQEYKMPRLAWL